LTRDSGEPYSAAISLVSTDTPSALPNAERAAAASQDPAERAIPQPRCCAMFDSGPTSDAGRVSATQRASD
jgi:hypothetical protein